MTWQWGSWNTIFVYRCEFLLCFQSTRRIFDAARFHVDTPCVVVWVYVIQVRIKVSYVPLSVRSVWKVQSIVVTVLAFFCSFNKYCWTICTETLDLYIKRGKKSCQNSYRKRNNIDRVCRLENMRQWPVLRAFR